MSSASADGHLLVGCLTFRCSRVQAEAILPWAWCPLRITGTQLSVFIWWDAEVLEWPLAWLLASCQPIGPGFVEATLTLVVNKAAFPAISL